MATENKILTAEQELKLRQPIDECVGGHQAKIDALRVDGTDRVIDIQSTLDNLKRDRIYTAQEKEARAAQLKKELEAAKAVENQNKAEISKLIADAESYLKAHYDAEYYQPLLASCRNEKSPLRRSTRPLWLSSTRSIRPPCPSSLTSTKSRTRSTFTKTVSSTPR